MIVIFQLPSALAEGIKDNKQTNGFRASEGTRLYTKCQPLISDWHSFQIFPSTSFQTKALAPTIAASPAFSLEGRTLILFLNVGRR